MRLRTLFRVDGSLVHGEVEMKMLPGLPLLQVVGLPDARMRECGLKVKSAIRSCGFEWPKGNQILVNLRPSLARKTAAGAELAIALGFLALTNQLAPQLRSQLDQYLVYGELTLDGRALAPLDFEQALGFAPDEKFLTGRCETRPRAGRWFELSNLAARSATAQIADFNWQKFFKPPEIEDLDLHPRAFENLWLSAYMGLNVLICGPQGSGKTTFARLLPALSAEPNPQRFRERSELFPEAGDTWRPCESPHHSTPAISMIGGGVPLYPGVITRAHGGTLIMDEFLEFSPTVLEALRGPTENGVIDLSRRGVKAKFPAAFQLVATSNLCPCGKLDPERYKEYGTGCGHSLLRCRSVCTRLSGPVLDRFDMLIFSHEWLKTSDAGPRKVSEAKALLKSMRQFAATRPRQTLKLPEQYAQMELSHRRRRAILKVARALADSEGSVPVTDTHFHSASTKVVDPMTVLGQLFA